MEFPTTRLRRLRTKPALRQLIAETRLQISDLVLPLFIRAEGQRRAINSLPGHDQLTLADLAAEIQQIQQLKIPAVLLFGIPSYKDELGSAAWQEQGIIQQAVRLIKKQAPELLVITDVCFCEYTSHGHCGVIEECQGERQVANDATLKLLAQQALSHAQAGADVIAPSGMQDGMVAAIRQALDQAGYTHTAILSYAVKYASALYGAFREAAECAPQFGDRQTYQMNPANGQEALREAALDIGEGADMIMVKPAQNYLDVIYCIKQTYPAVPLAAYQVSGEFAMIKAAAQQGWLDGQAVMMESLLAIKRAGANFIITYFAKEAAQLLRDFA